METCRTCARFSAGREAAESTGHILHPFKPFVALDEHHTSSCSGHRSHCGSPGFCPGRPPTPRQTSGLLFPCPISTPILRGDKRGQASHRPRVTLHHVARWRGPDTETMRSPGAGLACAGGGGPGDDRGDAPLSPPPPPPRPLPRGSCESAHSPGRGTRVSSRGPDCGGVG